MQSGKDKSTYVRKMFDDITPHYDLMNRLMTAGRDVAWRKMAAELMALPAGGTALDVAAGTADLSLAIQPALPRRRGHRPGLQRGDAGARLRQSRRRPGRRAAGLHDRRCAGTPVPRRRVRCRKQRAS